MAPTYSPQTGTFYVTARDQCDIFSTAPQPYEPGHAFYGSAYFPSEEAKPYLGFLKAIDPTTGQIKGTFQHTSPTWSGVLSTAGGLVFVAGTPDRMLRAFDSDTGQELWKAELPWAGYAAPAIYEVAMNSEEQTLIDGLFSRLQQAETDSAPRDAQAEARIRELETQLKQALTDFKSKVWKK